jgi:uncharacterized membrane protein
MSFVPLIATIVTVILISAVTRLEEALVFGLVVALVSSQLVLRGRFKGMQNQVDRLREQLDELRAAAVAAAAAEAEPPETVSESPLATAESAKSPPQPEEQETTEAIEEPPAPVVAAASMPAPAASVRDQAQARAKNPADHLEDLIRRIGNLVVSYFTDGNIFVRIGILILFFGVAFLLKYGGKLANPD